MTEGNPTLPYAIANAVAKALGGVHVAVPGTVLTYDPATGTATVQPAIPGAYIDALTGLRLPNIYPPVPSVPVLWPGCAAGSLTFPLVAGDTVLLVCADRSTDGWRNDGSIGVPPVDARRFDLSDSFAIPFMRIPSATGYGAGAVLESASVQLGNSTAVDFVALASLVLAQLQAIQIAFDAHTHGGVTVGAGVTAIPVAPMPAPSSPAATRVKAL
jgi:hypothetical protein